MKIQIYIAFISIPLLLMSILDLLEIKYGNMFDTGDNLKLIIITASVIIFSLILYAFSTGFSLSNRRLIYKFETNKDFNSNEAEKLLSNINSELFFIQISQFLIIAFIISFILYVLFQSALYR